MKPSDFSARLRRIASAIDASKRPSKALVASELRKIVAALKNPPQGWLTDTASMGSPSGPPAHHQPADMSTHLSQPESAVVVLTEDGRQVAVWNAPHDSSDPGWGTSFYFQDLPLDEPDATMFNGNAWEAILAAAG